MVEVHDKGILMLLYGFGLIKSCIGKHIHTHTHIQYTYKDQG